MPNTRLWDFLSFAISYTESQVQYLGILRLPKPLKNIKFAIYKKCAVIKFLKFDQFVQLTTRFLNFPQI